jgi:hypothetical protein
MKRGICALFVLLLAFTLIFTPTFAQSNDESVLIHPLLFPNGSTIKVTSDQEIILGIGWGACTPGLVRAFIQAVNLEWTLNGQLVLPQSEVPEFWGNIDVINPGPVSSCLAGNGTVWGSSWRYSLGNLEPGNYTVHFLEWLPHPLIDGGDYDGNGKMDLFSGVITDWSVTIQVTE